MRNSSIRSETQEAAAARDRGDIQEEQQQRKINRKTCISSIQIQFKGRNGEQHQEEEQQGKHKTAVGETQENSSREKQE